MEAEGLFKVDDINSIIKLFAFTIQERFDEIDGICSNNTDSHPYLNQNSSEDYEYLIRKYRNYMAYEEKQIKYLHKLTVRIIQIIQFFKQRSKNQQLLSYVTKKISDKLNKIVSSVPVDVEWLYSYILDLAKNGFSIKRNNPKDKRYSLKKFDNSELKMGESNQELKKQNFNSQAKEIKLCPSTAEPAKRRRPVSMNLKYQQKARTKQNKQSTETIANKLYSILDIDYTHIQKIIENKDKQKIQKESIKLNALVLGAIQIYDKMYSYSNSKKKQKNDVILTQVNNRLSIRPATNNWISRKKKFIECKKKKEDYQNFTLM